VLLKPVDTYILLNDNKEYKCTRWLLHFSQYPDIGNYANI